MNVKLAILLLSLVFIIPGVCASSPWSIDYKTMDKGIFSIAEYNGSQYAGSGDSGMIFYTEGGNGWCLAYDSDADTIRDLYVWNGYLYAGSGDTDGVIYRTNGTSLDIANDTAETTVECFESFGGYLYAGTGIDGKIYRTLDGLDYTEVEDLTDDIVYSLKEYKGYLYASTGTDGKVYRSSDGTTYNLFYTCADGYVYDMVVFGEYLYIASGESDGKIYRTDGTTTTMVYDTGFLNVWDLDVVGNAIYAAGDSGYIYRSVQGTTWELDFNTLAPYVYALGHNETKVWAGTGFTAGNLFILDASDGGGGWGIQYPPREVRFTFVDTLGSPVDDATVTCIPIGTSLGSWSWLSDVFGFSDDVDIAGSTLEGSTGSDGAVSFMMIAEVNYQISCVKTTDSISHNLTLYPKESEYFIRIGQLPYVTAYPEYNLTAWDLNATHVRLSMNYTDSANQTSSCRFVVENTTGSQVYNGSVVLTNGSGTAYYDVLNTRGDSYKYYFYANNSQHGNVTKAVGLDMKGSGPLVDVGLSDFYYMIISIALIFVVAGACGSSSDDIKVTGVVVPLFSGMLWYIGWLPATVGAIINATVVIGVLYYMRASYKAVDS